MSLKQLSHPQRIQFLIEFVGNIVSNSTKDIRLKKLIKVERLKRKLLPEPEPSLEHIGKSIIFEKPVQQMQKSTPVKRFQPNFHLKSPPGKMNSTPHVKSVIKTLRPSIEKGMEHNFLTDHETRSADKLIVEINKLINDKNVQMIECPGPNRNLLVKVRNNVNTTKLNLNEAEIKNIVMYFSDYARIPIVGGILKTSVDELIISAVVSEYAGSRFIINKRNPYDLIGQI